MLRRSTSLGLLVLSAALALVPSAQARLPRDFFGIVPQTAVDANDTKRMRHGGIEVMRVHVSWGAIQPAPDAAFDWGGLDATVAEAARARIRVMPFLYGTPRWLTRRETTLPVDSGRQRRAWATFVRAAAERYGTHGMFWQEHGPGSADFVPRRPIRDWQIWNEENFFYFTKPVSAPRYARLVRISDRALRQGDRRARLVLGGLFGDPKGRPPRAMDAAAFLDRLYRSPGIEMSFEGVALHPYAADVRDLRRLTEGLLRVIRRNRDGGARLYITEMGWGSQRNPRRVTFEVGWRQQARELRASYSYLIRNRRRLNLKQVHWFTWKDVRGSCDFCDSAGLFRRGAGFKPKPAWHALVQVARGRLR